MKKILLILSIIFILIGLSILVIFVQKSNENQENKNIMSNNNQQKISPISLEKIVLFSSASALNDYSNPWWNLNVYQYTDVAIYLSSDKSVTSSSNIIIDNFSFLEGPKLGTPQISYISPLDLGKHSADIYSNEKSENISYKITELSEEESFEKPTFFNNFSSPITFRYINKDIVKDYVLKSESSSSLTFDGTLLQKCFIDLEDIACKVSLDLTYKISDSEQYKYNLVFKIPLKTEDQSISNGNIIQTYTLENVTITQL